MVAHEHVGMQRHRMAFASALQQLQVVPAILMVHEHRPAVHTALGDVKRNPGQLQTGAAGHGDFHKRRTPAAFTVGVLTVIGTRARSEVGEAPAHSRARPEPLLSCS